MNLKNFPRKLDSKTSSLRIKVPENLDLALEGLIRKVLREQPKTDEIYSFSADYFEALLKIRERAGIKYAATQICPFHNDEDAHEMFKLADAFSKPHATEVDFSSNEKNKTISNSKDAQKKIFIGGGFGKIVEDEQIGDSGTIIGGLAVESSPEKKATNKEAKLKICELSEELKVEDDKEEFSSSDPLKELVEKELMERKAGLSAAKNNEVEPGGEGGKKEPEENIQRLETHNTLTYDLSLASPVNAEKEEEAGDGDKNLWKKNEVDKEKKAEVPSEIINKTFDKEEEVKGYFEKIREQETETGKVKGKESDKQSAKRNEEEKKSWKKATFKDEDVPGGVKTERKGAESFDILENAENRAKLLGSQENETGSDVKAGKENIKKESNSVADEVKEVEEKEVEKKRYENKKEAAEKLEEDETKISEKTSIVGKQRAINESYEDMTGEERGKKLQSEEIYVRGSRDEINLRVADEHGLKIKQQLGEEIAEIEGIKEIKRASFKERNEKGRREIFEAAGQVRGHSLKGREAMDEGVKPESEKKKEEVETNEMDKQEVGLELEVDKKENDPTRNQRKEELVEKIENIKLDTQEMKEVKDQKFAHDQETPRAKIHDLEHKELGEKTKILEEQVESETKNQNQPEKESEGVNRNSSESKNIKRKIEIAENGNPKQNSETECEAAKSEHEKIQDSKVVEEEGITMETRQVKPKNCEPLPTTKKNNDNPEDEEVLSKNMEKEKNPKDDEALPTAEKNEENFKDDEALLITKGNEENPKDDEALSTTKANEENSKDNEALLTTKGNEENPKNEETKKIDRSEDAQIEDYVELKAGKISRVMPAMVSNVAIKEAPIIEKNALGLEGGGVAVETEVGGAKAIERQSRIELPKNGKIEKGLREVDVREESSPEIKSERGGNEEKTEVEVKAETERKGQSESEAEIERKEERAEELEEEMCTVVDKINVVRIEQAEETEEETPYERQLKTIETHYYDLLQVPHTETSTIQMERTKENAVLEFDGKMKAPAVLSDKVLNPISDNSFDLSEFATCPSSVVSATKNFLNNEKQYNSRKEKDISHTTVETEEEESRKSGEMQESEEEVEDVMLKTKAPSETGAVPSAPRDLDKIHEESAAAEENIKGKEEEEKEGKSASSEDSHGATSSDSTDGDATFISVKVRTMVESQVPGEEEKGDQGEESTPEIDIKLEATIECAPETDVAASDRTDVEKESFHKKAILEPADSGNDEDNESSSKPAEETTDREGSSSKSEPPSSRADTEIKRPDSGKKNFTRSITQSLLTSQSLDFARRKSLVRTTSLSSLRPEVTDVKVWTANEKELEKAATKIQSEFRGSGRNWYKARKKLRRENAIQITTEESSNSFPTEKEYPRSTGEFHDTIVLSIHPR